MELHHGERVLYDGHPSWRSTIAFYLQGLLIVAAATVIAAIAGSTGLAVAVFVIGEALVILIGFIRRFFTVYTITNQRLRIKRGIIARHVQQTGIDRVQNVNTDQSVLERILRVGTVDFDTAGTDDSDFKFAGVEDPDEVVAAVDRAHREEHTAPSAA